MLCLGLLLVAGIAVATEYDKEAVYSATEAYRNGHSLTPDQVTLLRELHIYGVEQEPVIDLNGGPDAFGYIFKDSDEADGPTYNWIDITATGTEVSEDNLISDDDYIGPFPIGFTFSFYGTDRTQFYMHSNGVLSFEDWGDDAYFGNSGLPGNDGDLQGAAVCFLWDDFDPYNSGTYDGGQMYYETITLNDMQALVVSYVDYMPYPGSGTQVTCDFQVILFEDGTIVMQYDYLDPGYERNLDAETIGIINDDLSVWLEASLFDNPLDYPFDGLAIEFSQLDPNASLSGVVLNSATNSPIGGANVSVGGFSATTNASGEYSIPEMYAGTFPYSVSAAGFFTASGTLEVMEGVNTNDFLLDVNDADILVVDVDVTQDSGPAISQILQDLGETPFYVNDFFEEEWSSYEAVFLFTGVYPNDFDIATGSAEETYIIDYLNGGGKLYYESGDNFGFTAHDNLNAILPITGIGDGSGDLANVLGEDFMAGADMVYAGENQYIDEIEPAGDARRVFYNPADGAGCGVIDNSGDFYVALFTFEVGMLTDGTFTREDIVFGVLDNFGLGEPRPVEFDLFPVQTTVPPNGGNVVYDAQIVSNLGGPQQGDAWTIVTLPNGQPFRTLLVPIVVQPGTRTLTGLVQEIPALAPTGTYTFTANLGIFPNFVYISDDFQFEKTGVAADGVEGWTHSPLIADEDVTEVIALPDRYEMTTAYPNPFNPSTSIAISLPESSDLNVTVFNVMGQQVAELANGKFSAGQHDFSFDASNLASGLYFIQAQVPGQLNAIQKVTLMK